MMELLKANWPLLLIATWFIYKWWSTKRITKLLPNLKAQGGILVDVRSPAEFAAGHCQDSINIPLNELSTRVNELAKDRPIIVGCASGTRSGMAKMLLKKNGFEKVYNIGTWTNFKG